MNAEEILTKELKHDPCNCGYSGLDVDGVLAALLARVQVQIRPLSASQCLEWAAQGRAWAIVQAATTGRGPDGERLADDAKSVAVGAAALLSHHPDGVVDLKNDEHAAMLDVLVDSGVISSEDRQALYRMASVDVSRAEQLGVGNLRRGDVIRAMGAQ